MQVGGKSGGRRRKGSQEAEKRSRRGKVEGKMRKRRLACRYEERGICRQEMGSGGVSVEQRQEGVKMNVGGRGIRRSSSRRSR